MLQKIRFAIDEKPFCFNTIDSGFIEYSTSLPAAQIQDENKLYAFLSLRATYSHALETLFAIMFSALRAPDFIPGWILRYRQNDMKSLIKKIKSRQRILSKIKLTGYDRQSIASAILADLKRSDEHEEKRIKQNFATAWAYLADDFINDKRTNEYNSIKHGIRIKPGTFYAAEIICENHYFISEDASAWNPESIISALHLISMSIEDIESFLKIISGANPAEMKFFWPLEENGFFGRWDLAPTLDGIHIKRVLSPNQMTRITEEEILSVYSK